MWRTVSLVGPHGDRHFCNARTGSGRLDQRFRSKLHSVGTKIEPRGKVPGETSHAAIDVANAGAEKKIQDAGENRSTQVAMVPGHGALFDLAQETVADDEVVSGTPLLDEAGDFREIVTAVGVAENDECAASLGNAAAKGAAVSLNVGVDDSCSMIHCSVLRSV